MQLSKYDLILPLESKEGKTIEGKMLLFNGIYGASDVVDSLTAEALKDGKFDELSTFDRERLLTRGHLTDNQEREKEDIKLLARVDRKLRRGIAGLTILPTYNCNFRCPYCYERHRLSRGEKWLSQVMSTEMVDAIFNAADKMKKRGIRVDGCTLFGGEPFLRGNHSLIRYISEKAKEQNIHLSAVTNGYDLEHYIDLLKEFSFGGLQITLDGPKEINDRRRIHKDGTGSFDKILKNVKTAIDNEIKISLRVNVGPDNLEKAYSLQQIFKENGLTDSKYFSFYFKATSGEYYPGKNYGVDDKAIFQMLLKKGLSKEKAITLDSEYSITFDKFKYLFKKQGYFTPSSSFCGAENGMYVIDPNGLIFSCWNLVAKEDNAIGYVDIERGDFLFNFSLGKWRCRDVQYMAKCKECPYLFACGGGCAGVAFEETGDYMNEYCGTIKDAFDFIVSWLSGEAYEENKETELTKSLKEPLTKLSDKERETILTSNSEKEIFEIVKTFYTKNEKFSDPELRR